MTPKKRLERQEKWIKKAREIHGDKYDYSQVEFINSLTEVVIICKDHGPFKQKPKYHSQGNGCRKCGNSGKHEDLSGQEFGLLKVLKLSSDRAIPHLVYWDCLCACGNEVSVPAQYLKGGNTSSCGCKVFSSGYPSDLTGMTFADLIVGDKSRSNKHGHKEWFCTCACGSKKWISRNALIGGQASCGCIRVQDIAGQKFGMLKPLRYEVRLNRTKTKRSGFWLCDCDCGKQEWIYAANIIKGNASSCGCRKIRAIKEEPGATYGRLTVIERDGSAGRRTAWKCRCSCGEVITVSSNSLRRGNTQSCGCLMMDVLREKAHDLTGKRFGRLVAIKRDEEEELFYSNGSRKWRWILRCDCGNEHKATPALLNAGHVRSCGCLPTGSNSYTQFINSSDVAEEDCCIYFVMVRDTYQKIGIAKNIADRSKGDYTEINYERWMTRAEARGVELVALQWTEEHWPESLTEEWWAWPGYTELRNGLDEDTVKQMLDLLCDEVEEMGWEDFWAKYGLKA